MGSVRGATGELSAAVTPFEDIPFPGPGGQSLNRPEALAKALARSSANNDLGAMQRGKAGRRRLFAQPPGQILEAATECTLGFTSRPGRLCR